MTLHDDGDVIRGVGFVVIYASYVEEAIDSLLEILAPVEPVDNKLKRAQTSSKIKAIKRRLDKLDSGAFKDLLNDIDVCTALLEARHEIIHGRIYAQTAGPDMLHPGRPGKQKRPVSSIELYDLVNQLSTCRDLLIRPQVIEIPARIAEQFQT